MNKFINPLRKFGRHILNCLISYYYLKLFPFFFCLLTMNKPLNYTWNEINFPSLILHTGMYAWGYVPPKRITQKLRLIEFTEHFAIFFFNAIVVVLYRFIVYVCVCKIVCINESERERVSAICNAALLCFSLYFDKRGEGPSFCIH